MKKLAQVVFVLMLSVLFLGTYAWAAGETQKDVSQEQTQMGTGQAAGTTEAGKELSEARDWMDKKVIGANGEELGKVNNLFVSQEGQVTYVIVEADDDKLHPVPINMVQKDPASEDLRAQFDKQAFDESPSFASEDLPRLGEQEWDQRIRGYYEDKMKSGGTPTTGEQPKTQ